MGKLSDDSTTRCFSADANGYARSEGCVSLFLQRADHARRSYGSILSIKSRQFGSRDGKFTEFSQKSYEKLLREAYATAQVDPNEVAFFEADGVASGAADARELNAISGVLLPGRQKPLLIGSVKSNVGHTEAASSLVSIAKALIALDKGTIPPNLHYSSPNKDVPALVSGQLQVVTEPMPLPGDVIGVSCASKTGTYSHVVLKQNTRLKTEVLKTGELPPDGLPRLVLLTDRKEENITKNIKRLEGQPIDVEFVTLMNNLCKDGAKNHLYRGYTVLNGDHNPYNKIEPYASGLGRRPVWFMFSGMGSQWPGMGKRLMLLPAFAKAIYTCHYTLLSKGINLIDCVTNEDPKIFDNVLHAFVGIAAVQIGLVDVLRSIGVKPDGIVGHSLGEQGCGYADDCFTAEQMILSAYARGKASVDAKLVKGCMAAIGMGYQKIKDELPENVEVACRNSKDSCTISGPPEDVESFVEKLKQRGMFAKLVNVGDIAFHSKYIKPAGALLIDYLREVIPNPKKRSSRWISSSSPETHWDTELAQYCSAEYHANNMLSPVLFEEATSHIPQDAILIEIAPHALLQAIVKRSIPTAIHVPLTSRFDSDGLMFLLSAIGKLYISGIPVNIQNLYPPVHFPVSRGTPYLSSFIGWNHGEEFKFLRAKTDTKSCHKRVPIQLTDENYFKLTSHKLFGKCTVPESFYIEQLIKTFLEFKKTQSNAPVIIEDFKFENTCEASFRSYIKILFEIQYATEDFCISERQSKKIISRGRISLLDTKVFDLKGYSVVITKNSGGIEIDGHDFISLLKYQGLEVTGDFALIKKVFVYDDSIQALITWKGNLMEFLNNLCLLVGFYESKKSLSGLMLVKGAKQLILDLSAFESLPHSEIAAEYNAKTRTLLCHGLKLHLPEVEPPMLQTIQDDASYFSCEVPQFVPYKNHQVESINLLLEICSQLIQENLHQYEFQASIVKVFVIGDLFLNALTAVTQAPKYMGKFDLMNIHSEEAFSQFDKSALYQSVLWIVSITPLDKALIKTLESASKSFFLMPDETHNGEYQNELLEISNFLMGDSKFTLSSAYKGSEEKQYEVVHYDKGCIQLLQTKLTEANDANTRECNENHAVILSSTVESISSALQIIEETTTLSCDHLLRYLLVDDHKTDVTLCYNDQITKNLKHNIRLNGMWGSLRQLPFETDEQLGENDVQTGSPVYTISSVFPSEHIAAVGLNLNDITGSSEDDSINVYDYTTTTAMGLGIYDPVSNKFMKDTILEWRRPTSWSDTEAASIPLLYSMASYMIHVVNNHLRPGSEDSILINKGLLPISQALISIALGENKDVFVTVYKESEKKLLLEMFPALKDDNIFYCSNKTFYVDVLRRTKGQGIYKVINTFTEMEMIEPCVKCTEPMGVFIQLSAAPTLTKSHMGMLSFLSEIVAVGVTVDIMVNLPQIHKIQIRDYLQKALMNGHVKPLLNTFLLPSLTKNTEATRFLRTATAKGVVKNDNRLKKDVIENVFECDPSQNYIIFGGQPQSNFWLKLTEWLLRRGARRISVVLKHPNISPEFKLRLQYLNATYPTSRVHLHSMKLVSSESALRHFINDLESSASISSIFLIGTAVKDTSAVIDRVFQDKEQCEIICLGNGGELMCERRKRAGMKSLSIRCSTNFLETSSFLQCLDGLVANCIKNTVVNVNRYSLQSHNVQGTAGTEWTYLPGLLPELHDLLRLSSSKPSFVEFATASPRQALTKEVDTVFIIPGLRLRHARRIIQRLYYPTLVARLPWDAADIDSMASDLARQMTAFRQNYYTILADEWGGTLALHIASKLQILGKIASVILLDAGPATTRSWCSKILSDDLALVKKYVKLTPKIMSRVRECASWEDKVETIVDCSESKFDAERTCQGMTMLRNRLKGVLSVKPPATKNRILCHFFRGAPDTSTDQCGLNEYLQKPAELHVKEVNDTLTMIDESIDEINTFTLFEYRDAAYPPDENKIGIGFLSDTKPTSANLVLAYGTV